MRIKLTLARESGSHDDIVVTADAAATIAEVAQAIHAADPRGPSDRAPASPLTLRAVLPGSDEPLILPPDAAIGEAWIGSGATVTLVDAGTYFQPPRTGARPTAATVSVLSGPDAGTRLEFPTGTVLIGRDPSCDVVLPDPLVSKRHVRLEVDAATELIDLGSANGVVVDGGIVSRLRVTDRVVITLGDTDLEIAAVGSSGRTGAAPTAGPVFFNRSPRVEPRYPGARIDGPAVPKEIGQEPFPFLAMIAPLVMGTVLFVVSRNPQTLLFVGLSPLLMVGNFVTQRTQRRRKQKSEITRFEGQLSRLTERMTAEREEERIARLREAPSSAEVLEQAHARGPLLWTRRPEHWNFLNLRIGLGTMRSRNTITRESAGDTLPDFQERFDRVADENRDMAATPVVDNLHESGAIGIAGSVDGAVGAVNALLVQVTGLHSPAEVVVAALTSPAWSSRFDWLKWMPHTNSPHSPVQGGMLADSASSGGQLLSAIEGVVQSRASAAEAERRGATSDQNLAIVRGANVGAEGAAQYGTRSPVPSIVLLITDDAPVDRARLVQLAETAADAGVYPIWIADAVADLPAVCRTFVDLTGEAAAAGLVRLGEVIDEIQVEEVSPADALDFARRMSPVVDAGALVADSSDLPRAVSLVTLLGHELVESSDAIIDRWRQNESIHDRTPGSAPARRKQPGKLRAIVGSAGVDPMHLDLRTQGPHALVGGTTGAGKSEFLQAWVLGMAAEYSPDRVTFLFVDYKGGSAFADCVTLPHCVGLVTDLSPHLVRRALTSLRAELHHREHLLNRKKAKDLLELERRGDPDSPPALVLVIDEFAALAGEVPEFVDGVVDIAQRGRSLGIHLIMATQRPAGVIKDNLRANTNMRVALRMADESDSQDVVGVKDAGGFDPGLPGRGLAKTGPGRLTMFQSGYAGGWTSREPERADIDVVELRFGGEIRWEPPTAADDGDDAGRDKDLGPTDQQRLVRRMIEAGKSAGIPAPRRPWLDELATSYDLGKLRQRTDAELLLGVVDLPDQQVQTPAYFRPDVDGSLAIFGTGGSGKSGALRSLAAAAGITPRGGPVHVYALDFGSGGLKILEPLPQVGAVIAGDDIDRAVRLFRMLQAEFERRGPAYAEAEASSIVEYRKLAHQPDEPRILLLIDDFASFREDFEMAVGRERWWNVFRDVLISGRPLGMHVALTADRAGALPGSISSAIQRKIVLRLADDGYRALDVPNDILTAESAPGRAIIDGNEAQLAILGGSRSVQDQSAATRELAAAIARSGFAPAPAIGSLPAEYSGDELPDSVAGEPVLGLSDIDLGPFAFDPTGTMLISGPPASGRTTALGAVSDAMRRADPAARFYYIGSARASLARSRPWVYAATNPDQAKHLAQLLTPAVEDEDTEGRIVVVIEGAGDYLQSSAENALVSLVKAIKRSSHFVVAEAESATWNSSWPLISEFKNARRGLLLQPDSLEGEILLKTPFPRAAKSEFPPGRGMYAARNRIARVQLALVDIADPAFGADGELSPSPPAPAADSVEDSQTSSMFGALPWT